MEDVSKWLENNLMPYAGKLGSNKILLAIRDGVTLALPLIITGSFFMIISSFPIEAWTNWLVQSGYDAYLSKITNGSFGLIGLIASFGVAHSLATNYKVNGLSAGIISLSSYVIVTPDLFFEDTGNIFSGIDYTYTGSQGLFVSIVVGLISGWIFQWFINHEISIKMPDSVPPAVSASFSGLIPGLVIISLWGMIYALLDSFGIGNIHDIVTLVIGKPMSLLGGTLSGTIIAIIMNSLFWFVGINGGDAFNNVLVPTWIINSDANRLAFESGVAASELPNIITYPFMYNFVYMGGGGATLGLVIVIFIMSRRKKSSRTSKTMAPLTLIPGIFNINEPAIFGIPLVMNLKLLIPFILAPVVNAIVSYTAMAINLVPKPTGVIIPWTMPPIISGWLATGGSIRGSLLQIICLILDIALYYVFYKLYDDNLLRQEEL